MACLQDQIIVQDYSIDPPLHYPFSYLFPIEKESTEMNGRIPRKWWQFWGEQNILIQKKLKFLAFFSLNSNIREIINDLEIVKCILENI